MKRLRLAITSAVTAVIVSGGIAACIDETKPQYEAATITNTTGLLHNYTVQVVEMKNGIPYAEAEHAVITPEQFKLNPGQSITVIVARNGDSNIVIVPEIINPESVQLLSPISLPW